MSAARVFQSIISGAQTESSDWSTVVQPVIGPNSQTLKKSNLKTVSEKKNYSKDPHSQLFHYCPQVGAVTNTVEPCGSIRVLVFFLALTCSIQT